MFYIHTRQGLVYREAIPRGGSGRVKKKINHTEEGSHLCEWNEQERVYAR